MAFPDQNVSSIADYIDAYAQAVQEAIASVDREALEAARALLMAAISEDRLIYVCGNGGSAAISNHLVCDCSKGCQTDTGLRPRVHSLSNNMELITAIANDISYDDVFVYQLSTVGRPGDVLITVSSSGDSENVVRASAWAKRQGLKSLALTGFDGGRTAEQATVNLHVHAHNYGVVEDAHQSLMHILAQFIRMQRMPAELVPERFF